MALPVWRGKVLVPAEAPHNFGCVAASSDAVALDAIMSRAMGFRQGEVLHVAHAGSRGLGNVELENIQICGDPAILSFGRLNLPHNHRLFDIPSWLSCTPLPAN